MQTVPQTMLEKLPKLHGLLLRGGYIEDPQVMFSAIGDAECDAVPIQVGEWESDNRQDANLDNFVLEGGGGGQFQESYDLGFFFMARCTGTDAWDKRRKKGYVFFIGDEKGRNVSAVRVREHIGIELEDDIPLAQIVKEMKERYNVYFIIPTNTSHGSSDLDELKTFWKRYFGENVLVIDDEAAIPELIAATIGMMEGATDDVGADLLAAGSTPLLADTVTKALAPISGGAVVKGSGGNLPGMDDDKPSGKRRL
jgi:hypothetical protein